MPFEEPKIILYDSPEAAKQVTVTGWQARNGHFWYADEHMARYEGSTHRKCDCGNIIAKNSYCEPCHAKRKREDWLKMPLVEWDGEGMIAIHDGDQYFSELEEFYEFCHDNELRPDEVMLVIADPQHLSEVTTEFWSDELCEDQELPPEIKDKLDELNKAIENYKKPISYWHGKKRVIIPTPADWPKDE